MDRREMQKIWIDQCGAARAIRERHGLTQAFDYLVGEKLLNYASAASRHPEFARELPNFVAEVRRMFTPEEIRVHLARVDRELAARAMEYSPEDGDYVLREDTATLEARAQQFMTIKEMLTASTLGTS